MDLLQLGAAADGALVGVVIMRGSLMLSVGLAVMMGGVAEQFHAAKATDAHFMANLGGRGLGSGFGCTHVGGELGEETAHDGAALGVKRSRWCLEYIDDVELMGVELVLRSDDAVRAQKCLLTAELASLRSLIWMSST